LRRRSLVSLGAGDNAVRDEAGSRGAALEIVDRQPNFELAVVDFAMPGMNGAKARPVFESRCALVELTTLGGRVERIGTMVVDRLRDCDRRKLQRESEHAHLE
jgi:hypothetical protein